MSDIPDLPEDEALAAEYALGVLSGAERATAARRVATQPAFAALVDAWRARLLPLSEGVAAALPPPGLWDRIARSLPVNDNQIARRLRFWRTAAGGAMTLAAASLAVAVVLVARPDPAPTPPSAPPPMLNASLTSAAGAQPLFVAAYDPMRQALIVTSLVPPGADPLHVHQLWLIGGDGQPQSLGFVEPGKSAAMPMPQSLTALVAEGASLAVSVEAPGGSPNPSGPTGPIAASGKLTPL